MADHSEALKVLHLFPLLTSDAVFPHPGAKSAGVETKEYRRSVFPFDAPAGFLKHLKDMVLFQIGDGFDILPYQFSCLPDRLEPVHNLEGSPLTGDHRPLDDTFQLPHVSGPVVFLEGVQGLFCHGIYLLAHFLVELGDKMFDEQRDVFLALPEWRDRDGENIEPVEQVFPEPARANLFFKVPVAGCNDPYIDLDSAGAAQPLELAILNDPEKLALQFQRHLADFVEKYGATVGQFEAPHLPGISPGERTPFPPEKFALDEVRR